jgi:hypothetical protein
MTSNPNPGRSYSWRVYISVLGLLVASMACSVPSLSPPTATLPPTETPLPAPTDTPLPEPTTVPKEDAPTPTPAPTEVPPTATPRPAAVLVVYEDVLSGRPDFTSGDEIALSLYQLDMSFNTWSTLNDGIPSQDTLYNYDVVIWTAGDDCCNSPPRDSVIAIAAYLSDGGAVLYEGGSVIYPWNGSGFLDEFVGVKWTGYSPVGDMLVSDADHPIANGFPVGSIDLNVNGAVQPDAIDATTADAVFVRGPNSAERGKALVTARDTGTFRMVYSAVPLQWFYSDDRKLFLTNVIDWLYQGSD